MPKPVICPKFTVLRIIRYPACLEIDGTTWDKPQSCIDHLLPPGLEMLMCQECRNIPDAYGPQLCRFTMVAAMTTIVIIYSLVRSIGVIPETSHVILSTKEGVIPCQLSW